MRFTLDNNCLIAVARGEPMADAIQSLVLAHDEERAVVAVLGMSASERQPGGRYLVNIQEFRDYLGEIGLDRLEIYKPTGIYDVTFYDWSVYGSDGTEKLAQSIHAIMFASPYGWAEIAAAYGEDPNSTDGPGYKQWRNRRCDVQGMLAHIMHDGDIFVTSDRHFLDRTGKLMEIGAKSIATPTEAAALLG